MRTTREDSHEDTLESRGALTRRPGRRCWRCREGGMRGRAGNEKAPAMREGLAGTHSLSLGPKAKAPDRIAPPRLSSLTALGDFFGYFLQARRAAKSSSDGR